jgi:pyridoxal-phosphate dependent TrpB-like enzyme
MNDDLLIGDWHNIIPDIPVDIPPVINSPGKDEIGNFARITPKGLQYLNLSKRRTHAIPDDVRENYSRFGRPTPLVRAKNLEKYLSTPAKIYFKREDGIPTGSFKLNTALAQASRARQEGYEGVVTETGAGQWGLAISAACAIYKLKCMIFMARCSYNQKPLRRQLMEFYGAEVQASPGSTTESGKRLQEDSRFFEGSIGTAISEAMDFSLHHPSYAYVAGSNLPFVYIHQSIMGLEAIRQFRALGEEPDTILACVGGGSNLAGFALPFAFSGEKLDRPPQIIGCESAVIPRMTRGEYRYDHSDPMGLSPLVKSYTLGKDFTPPPTHVGGLRQHNGSPVIGALVKHRLITASAYEEKEIFAAGQLMATLEGIIPSPESCHGVAGVIEQALAAKHRGEKITIVSCISGSGILDFSGFLEYLKKTSN